MLENALDHEGLKHYDKKSKEYIEKNFRPVTEYADTTEGVTINDLITDGSWRIRITSGSDTAVYLGIDSAQTFTLLVETFVDTNASDSVVAQKITRLYDGKIYFRYTTDQVNNPLSFKTELAFVTGDAASKAIKNLTGKSSLELVSNTDDGLALPTINTLAFWNGAYNSYNASNLTYCNKGAFGTAATREVDTTATDNSTNLITSGAMYTALAGKLSTDGVAEYAKRLSDEYAIDGLIFQGNGDVTRLCTCYTAGSTKEKTVTCGNFKLAQGARVLVKFNNFSTASSPTLNVNSTGAYTMYHNGSTFVPGELETDKIYEFVYTSSRYELVGASDVNAERTVTYNISSQNSNYPLLFAPDDNNTLTNGTKHNVNYNTGLTVNPSTNTINANISGDASTLGGKSLLAKGATDTWDGIPYVADTGVMEIGKYIDFHVTDGDTTNYNVRITATEDGLTLGGKTTLSITTPIKIVDDAGQTKSIIGLYNPTPDSPVTTGSELVVTSGGNVFIGGGESAPSIRNNLISIAEAGTGTLADEIVYNAESEQMYISADSNLWLYSNCNDVAYRKGIFLNTSGELLPLHADSYNIGRADNYTWNKIYANNFNSAKVSTTFLAGNQGEAIINSTATAGLYVALDKLNSTNGYFCDGVFKDSRYLLYTSKEIVDAGTNAYTHKVLLLNENGESAFQTLYANRFLGNGVKTLTVKGSLGLVNLADDGLMIPNIATLAFWNGAYNSYNASNLTYCNKGAFGTAATREVDTTATDNSTNLITSGAMYTALAGKLSTDGVAASAKTVLSTVSTATGAYYNIPFHSNNDTTGNKSLFNSNGLYIRDQIAVEGGANGYSCLILGNNTDASTTGGKYGAINMYSHGAYQGKFRMGTLTGDRQYTFPDESGTIALKSNCMGFPDYSAQTQIISVAAGATKEYTITQNGYIQLQGTLDTTRTASAGAYLYVNDSVVECSYCIKTARDVFTTAMFPVKVGDIVKVVNDYDSCEVFFYPFR